MFLWKKEIKLPADETPDLTIGDPEVRTVVTLTTETKERVSLADLLSKISSWSLAVRAVAHILRHIRRNRSNSLTTVTEREDAEHHIIKDLQENMYQEVMKLLSKRIQLPSPDRLHSLDAFLDQGGILSVGARLGNSSLPDSIKLPAIIPKSHPIKKMLIAHHH